jgi:hypothetical protein
MNNNFSTTRKSGRLTCVWAPTGNPKSPLACVWMDAGPYEESSSKRRSSDTEVEGMQRCA